MLMALSLFVAGRFGFFDILGLKRLLEVLLFLPLGLLGLLFILKRPKNCLNPFFLLPLSYFVFQLYWNPDQFELADLAVSTLVVAIILALGDVFSDLLLRYTLNIATVFAVLGLIEFSALIMEPSLVNNILLFYDYYSGSSVPVIQNAWQLLGLSDGTSYHLWGMAVTRLRSFTSEPSLLVGYFLVPGALGLTYKGKYAVYGLICIAFCICSFAGSVFAALFFSVLSIALVILKKPRLSTVLPFFILCLFIWILNSHFADLILLTKTTGGSYDFLDKTNSATVRFSYIRDFIPRVVTSPFGLDEELHQPLGLLIGSAARGGLFGFACILIILTRLYGSLALLFTSSNLDRLQKTGLLIVYGSLITGILYLDNCFIQIYGFTLLLLTHNRIQKLTAQSDKLRQRFDSHTWETGDDVGYAHAQGTVGHREG